MGYILALKKEYEAKKLRKGGKEVQLKLRKKVPIAEMVTGLLDTMEGAVLWNRIPKELYEKINRQYKLLSPKERRLMLFSSENPGGYLERAEWWRNFLQLMLSPKDVSRVMIILSKWYRRNIAGHKTGVWKDITE